MFDGNQAAQPDGGSIRQQYLRIKCEKYAFCVRSKIPRSLSSAHENGSKNKSCMKI